MFLIGLYAVLNIDVVVELTKSQEVMNDNTHMDD